MDINQIIAANLTAWMSSSSLDTVQKLEEESGVGFGTIRRARKGEGNITAKNMALIAAAFGRQPAELMIPPAASIEPDSSAYDAPADSSATRIVAAEPTPLPVKNERERLVDRINSLLPELSEYGLVAVLEKAKEAAIDYPAAKQTQKSSP